MATVRAVSTSSRSEPSTTPDLADVGDQLARNEWLDNVVEPLEQLGERVLPKGPVTDALQGKWLGHPLHPVLTDLPIGFWTSSFVLDLVPLKSARRVAGAFVGLGVVTALPTAASGLADWLEMPREDKRIGVVHMAANVAALTLYTMSLAARVRGRRFSGRMLGFAGAAAATAGGYLGGHLVYRRGAGVFQSGT